LALLLYPVFVAVTVLGEETMFRGLIQTRVGRTYGMGLGILPAVALFGLRHLPDALEKAPTLRP
jgi:membrane protease YdiL (CAAX protease family)